MKQLLTILIIFLSLNVYSQRYTFKHAHNIVWNTACIDTIKIAAPELHFEGYQRADYHLLEWRAAITPFEYFQVERSFDKINFVRHGARYAQACFLYEYLVYDYKEGKNHYRLKIVNKDGSHTYSNIITVKSDNNYHVKGIHPNPAIRGQTIKIEVNGVHKPYKVSTEGGKVIMTGTIDQVEEITVKKRGVYFITIWNGDKATTHRLKVL